MECLTHYFVQLPVHSDDILYEDGKYAQCTDYPVRQKIIRPPNKLFLKFEEKGVSAKHVWKTILLEELHIPELYLNFFMRSLRDFVVEEKVFRFLGSRKAYLVLELLDKPFTDVTPTHEAGLGLFLSFLLDKNVKLHTVYAWRDGLIDTLEIKM